MSQYRTVKCDLADSSAEKVVDICVDSRRAHRGKIIIDHCRVVCRFQVGCPAEVVENIRHVQTEPLNLAGLDWWVRYAGIFFVTLEEALEHGHTRLEADLAALRIGMFCDTLKLFEIELHYDTSFRRNFMNAEIIKGEHIRDNKKVYIIRNAKKNT